MTSRRALPLRVVQLAVSCMILGAGVGMLLLAALGSDGYSTFVNGLSLMLGVPFLAVNCVLGVVLVAMSWWRGLVPGIGTVVQPVVVGATVSSVLSWFDAPSGLLPRSVLLVVAFVVLGGGVAGYLGSATGAGPTEAAALAFDPPVPFRWSYTVVQGGGALGGWLLGAAIGPGTLIVIALLGPAVDLITRRIPALGQPVGRDLRTPPRAGRVQVRWAVLDDAARIADVHVCGWQRGYHGLLPQELLDGLEPAQRLPRWTAVLRQADWPRRGTLVVDDGADVWGFADLGPSRDADADRTVTGEINSFYVHPRSWRGGVGRMLIAATVSTLAGAGYTEGTLWVLDTNDTARRFYENAGWSPDGATKHGVVGGRRIQDVRYRRSLR